MAAPFPWTFLGYNCCFGFRHVKVYCNSDNALAGLIREIRNDFLYVPGFQLSELEEYLYVVSYLPYTLFEPTFWHVLNNNNTRECNL